MNLLFLTAFYQVCAVSQMIVLKKSYSKVIEVVFPSILSIINMNMSTINIRER